MPVALGVPPPATLARPSTAYSRRRLPPPSLESCASRAQATHRDVGRYDSRDGGGRAAPGAAAEGNAGDPHGRGKVGAASATHRDVGR